MDLLIRKHLESRNEKFVGDNSKIGELLVPYLLMDASNIIRFEYLSHLSLRHNSKRFYSKWVDAHTAFIRDFFSPFTEDEQLELTDIMDEFSTYIHNDLEKLRLCILLKFQSYSEDLRTQMAAILCCNVLSQAAQHVYQHFRRKPNRHIATCEKWNHEFLNEWSSKESLDPREVDLTSFKDLHDLVGVLANRIKSFIATQTKN